MNDKEKLIEQLLSQMNKIFFFCVKRCNSRIDAEDLSQDILLDIIVNINKGINIKNFNYYIWQICKNHYSKYVARNVKNKETISFVEKVSKLNNELNSLDNLVNAEKIAMINASIKLLSSDYSQILYSYYIEDRSLSYIAKKLNLPLGTIKSRLFNIRKKLKEYLKMERLNGKKAFVPKRFTTSMAGWGAINPHHYTKSLINKNILFHSYDNPCTLEDYSLELGISIPYIQEIVNELVNATLLTKIGNKYVTNFPIITKETNIQLSKVIQEKGKAYGQMLVEFANKHFVKFKEIINNEHFSDNELMWVFMFYINRIAEQYPIDKKGEERKLKYRHIDNKGAWDFHMSEEDHESKTMYPINEIWFGNLNNLGIQGICHPAGRFDSDEAIFKTICYHNCINGSGDSDNFNLEYIEYIIKNATIKYSQIEKNQKYKVDFLIDNNYLYIENDKLKFNFVVLNHSQFKELNSYFEYHEELKTIKEQRNKIVDKIKNIIMNSLPTFLHVDADYLSTGYFYENIREYVIRAFAENGLIKPNNTNKRFNFNAYAWTFSD